MTIKVFNLICVIYVIAMFSTCGVKSKEINSYKTIDKVETSDTFVSGEFPFDYDPHYAKIFDQNNWLIADNQAVWITNNGGQNWQKSIEPVDSDKKPVNVRGLSFIDNKIVYLATDDSLIRSDDYGQTWHKQSKLSFSTNAIFFLDEKKGWAVATVFRDDWTAEGEIPLFQGAIYTTSDGGISWKENQIDKIHNSSLSLDKWTLSDIVVFDNGNGFAVGDGVILKTNDNGNSWKIIDEKKYKFQKLGYLNANLVWITIASGHEFLLTETGGKSWQIIQTPQVNRDSVLFLILFDKNTALIGFNDIYKTLNLGKSWTKIESNYYLYYVELLKDGSLIALGRNEKSSFALVSYDRGSSWIKSQR